MGVIRTVHTQGAVFVSGSLCTRAATGEVPGLGEEDACGKWVAGPTLISRDSSEAAQSTQQVWSPEDRGTGKPQAGLERGLQKNRWRGAEGNQHVKWGEQGIPGHGPSPEDGVARIHLLCSQEGHLMGSWNKPDEPPLRLNPKC